MDRLSCVAVSVSVSSVANAEVVLMRSNDGIDDN